MGKINGKIILSSSIVLLAIFVLGSCNDKKEVMLPKSNQTILSTIGEHSPVYFFFKTTQKDTLIEVNRNNTISSTHWVFNIDKRLPLRLVIPQLIALKDKKEKSMHNDESAQTYFSYADSVHKNLAFIPFTKTNYFVEKPQRGVSIYFDSANQIWIGGVAIKKEAFLVYFSQYILSKNLEYYFCFSKNMSFGSYLQNQIFIEKIKATSKANDKLSIKEYVY